MSLTKNKESLFGNKGSTSGTASTAPKATTTTSHASTTSTTIAGAGKTAGLTFKGVDSSSQGPSMSVEARRKKITEAREQSEKGMNALKTTLFQWKPDHLSAATYFERSADLYKAAGDLKNSLLLTVQAAQSHEACGAMASTALLKMKAAGLASEQGDLAQSRALLLEAAEAWGVHGDLVKYGETLAKLAKEEEDHDGKRAAELYLQGKRCLHSRLFSPSPSLHTHRDLLIVFVFRC